MDNTQFHGLCIDGPLDGKRLSHTIKYYRVPIKQKIESWTNGYLDEPASHTATVETFQYEYFELGGVGFWIDANPSDPRRYIKLLAANYRPAV